MINRILLITGSLLLLVALVWKISLAPHWTQRLPPGWTWRANYIGISATPDPATGRFPAENSPATYQRSTRILSDAGRPRHVKVEDSFTIRDIDTGKVT